MSRSKLIGNFAEFSRVEKYIVLKCQRPLWVISGSRHVRVMSVIPQHVDTEAARTSAGSATTAEAAATAAKIR